MAAPTRRRFLDTRAVPTELVPGVYWLDLGIVNAYVVEDGDDLVLCDAGAPWSAYAIEDRLTALGYDPSDVDRVLLTHYDLDHVGALSKLDLHAPVYAGAFDGALLRGDDEPPLTNHKGLIQRAAGRWLDRPRLPVMEASDGEPIGSFTAYHTPGHTPGHVVYVSEALDVALLGDLVRERDGELEPSSWPISYDAGEARESIRSLADRDLEFEAAGVGHGEPLSEGGSAALSAVLPEEPPAPSEPVAEKERFARRARRVRRVAGGVTGATARVKRVADRVKRAVRRVGRVASQIR